MAIANLPFWQGLSAKDCFDFKAEITNITKGTDLTNFIDEVVFSYDGKSSKIRSIVASFTLDNKDLISSNDIIEISAISGDGTVTTPLLTGKAQLQKRSFYSYYAHSIDVQVFSEMGKLFEKTVAQDVFYFDQWIYYSSQQENSLVYQMAKLLGLNVSDIVFSDIRDSQARLIKVPFMVFEKDNRWIDELETLLDCVRGQMYINADGKIVIEGGLYQSSSTVDYTYDTSNILSEIQQVYSYPEYNGTEQKFDTYDYGENQVVFDLSQTMTVAANTTSTNMIYNIKYITDCVTQFGITNAHGYYFNPAMQQIDVPLVAGVDYEIIKLGNAGGQVKFYNNRPDLLYIDHFEIKGRPVYKYADNESIVRDNTITDDSQNNLVTLGANKYIQSLDFAKDVCEYEYHQQCEDTVNYSFKALFSPFILPNHLIQITIDNINTVAKVTNVEHTLSRSNGFYTKITAKKFVIIPQTFSYKTVQSLSNTSTYLQKINELDNKIDNVDITVDLDKLDEKIQAEIDKQNVKGWIIEKSTDTFPTATRDGDCVFVKDQKKFYVWRNGSWQTAVEDDIPPALLHSLMAQAGYFQIGQTDTYAGLFFQYDNDTNSPIFGATDTSTLAQITIDKKAGILMQNVNNRIQLSLKDPAHPSRVTSQILLGVTNVNSTIHDGTIFQVGEEGNGTYIKLTAGALGLFAGGMDMSTVKGQINTINSNVSTATSTANTANSTATTANTTANGNTTRLNTGNFVIGANTTINGMLSVFSDDKGIISYNGTNEANSTQRIVIKGGAILFQEKG